VNQKPLQLVLFAGGRVLILENDVQGVNDTGNVTQDGQEDVNEEVGIASTLKENTKRREEDGEDDLDNI